MERLKISQFTMFVENYPQTGHHLVYNTFSRSLIEVDNQCLSMLYSLEDEEPSESAMPALQEFRVQRIVVPAELDEAELYWHEFSAQRMRSKQLHATVLTTLDCPMRCVYCFQKDIGNRGHMTRDTMERTVSWLEEQIWKREIDRCFIIFYGGEPLMNFAPIEYISGKIGGYCRDKGIGIHLGMVTSGLLLTWEVAEKLKRTGVRHLQITLDGDKDTHDKRRPCRDGSGTFDQIMENLDHLVNDFFITISCNVDRRNTEAAYRLVDILDSRGFAGKIRRFAFGPVSASFKSGQRSHMACPEMTDQDLTLLNLYAASKGFTYDLRPKHKICGMLLPSHFVIDPDGSLYTCPAFLGREEYEAGAVDQPGDVGVRELSDFELSEECLGCMYVPICSGGCRFNALIEQEDIKAVDCRREILSYSLPLLLKAYYALRDRDVQSSDIVEGN